MESAEAIRIILERFGELSAVPRGSGREDRAREWVEAWARRRGLEHRRDAAGNLVVRVPQSEGAAPMPPVVLQGHLDMVCEKTPDSTHDFTRDPIVPVRDGDWLRARGTTLGADNGIAVALAMALAEDPALRRPPLELVFTVEEETGLHGARSLDPGLLQGRLLLNLDSEAEGVLTVGCAGGQDTTIDLPLSREAPSGGTWYSVTVSGASGGHSGVDIHLGRANACLLLARVLAAARCGEGLRIATIEGGSARNAIPRDATAQVWMPDATAARFPEAVAAEETLLRKEYSSTDPTLRVQARRIEPAPLACPARQSSLLLDLLLALPNGVAGICRDFPGTVETSNNIGVVRNTDSGVRIVSAQRSSSAARMADLTGRIRCVAALAGASAREDSGYPPWQPDAASPLLDRARRAWSARHGTDPEVRIIHAGLECAVIGDRYPGMDMISLGPTVEGAHSPDERLFIPSLRGVWDLVVDLLASLAE